MARCELFKPSLEKVLGWSSSGDPKPTLASASCETTGKIVLNTPKEAAG
jgi:hypothetical protein